MAKSSASLVVRREGKVTVPSPLATKHAVPFGRSLYKWTVSTYLCWTYCLFYPLQKMSRVVFSWKGISGWFLLRGDVLRRRSLEIVEAHLGYFAQLRRSVPTFYSLDSRLQTVQIILHLDLTCSCLFAGMSEWWQMYRQKYLHVFGGV